MNYAYSKFVSRNVVSRNVVSRNVVSRNVVTLVVTALVFGLISMASPSRTYSQSAAFKVSGDGVIGQDSVMVGKDFSLDLYLTNGGKLLGFTLGFQMTGKNGLKSVTHIRPKDSDGKESKDLESNITAYNGFESTTYWDMGQLQKPVYSWDGKLPDSLLLGGVAMNKGWPKTDKPTHYVSIALRANQAGSVCIDSAFIPPSGAWLFAPKTRPEWAGEYCVTAVGGNPCAGKGKGKK